MRPWPGNGLIGVTKFVASAWTGGSAMMAECVHSLVDMGNQLLLLHGLRQADRLLGRTQVRATHWTSQSPLSFPYWNQIRGGGVGDFAASRRGGVHHPTGL
jgi:hypothetical protein